MPNGQPRRALDASRARELFGFEARTPLRDGLERTVAWYRADAPRACGSLTRSSRRPRLLLAVAAPAPWLSTAAAALWSRGRSRLSEPLVLANVFLPARARRRLRALCVPRRRRRSPPGRCAVWLAGPWLLVALRARDLRRDGCVTRAALPVGLTADPACGRRGGARRRRAACLRSRLRGCASPPACGRRRRPLVSSDARLSSPAPAPTPRVAPTSGRRARSAVAPLAVVAALRDVARADDVSWDAFSGTWTACASTCGRTASSSGCRSPARSASRSARRRSRCARRRMVRRASRPSLEGASSVLRAPGLRLFSVAFPRLSRALALLTPPCARSRRAVRLGVRVTAR